MVALSHVLKSFRPKVKGRNISLFSNILEGGGGEMAHRIEMAYATRIQGEAPQKSAERGRQKPRMSVIVVCVQSAQWGEDTMGSTFLKAIYREFTDDTFTVRKPQEHASDAMAGPTLRAEVGDMITVVFQVSSLIPPPPGGKSKSPSSADPHVQHSTSPAVEAYMNTSCSSLSWAPSVAKLPRRDGGGFRV